MKTTGQPQVQNSLVHILYRQGQLCLDLLIQYYDTSTTDGRAPAAKLQHVHRLFVLIFSNGKHWRKDCPLLDVQQNYPPQPTNLVSTDMLQFCNACKTNKGWILKGKHDFIIVTAPESFKNNTCTKHARPLKMLSSVTSRAPGSPVQRKWKHSNYSVHMPCISSACHTQKRNQHCKS